MPSVTYLENSGFIFHPTNNQKSTKDDKSKEDEKQFSSSSNQEDLKEEEDIKEEEEGEEIKGYGSMMEEEGDDEFEPLRIWGCPFSWPSRSSNSAFQVIIIWIFKLKIFYHV